MTYDNNQLLLLASRFNQKVFFNFPQTANKGHEKCHTNVRLAKPKLKFQFQNVYFTNTFLLYEILIVRNLELEIIIILVSSKIGSINDGTPETLKTKTWIRSSKSRRVIMKNILFVSKDGSPLMLNFLQTT